MNTKRLAYIFASFLTGLITVAFLFVLLAVQSNLVHAEPIAPAATIRYVSLTGNDTSNDCTTVATPCRTVQHAVALAQAGDDIEVATGTYTGTVYYIGSSWPFGITATVIISKDIASLTGGYPSDFSNRDSDLYPTTLNASDTPNGFVVAITGTNTLLDGFTLTGATGACPGDCSDFVYIGGAIRTINASPTISHNRIQGNFGYAGGGIGCTGSGTPTITDNLIYSNTTNWDGGGIFIKTTTAVVISGNQVISNVAELEGGGIYLVDTVGSIVSNTIAYNEVISPTEGRGGGVFTVGDGLVTIEHNEIYSNSLTGGGSGLDIASPAIIDGNYVHHNKVMDWGGSIVAADTNQPITLTNNIIAENQGDGITAINFRDVRIINNTIANNTWTGLEVFAWPVTPTVPLTATVFNNIVLTQWNCGGISAFNGVTLIADYNNWYNKNGSFDFCGGLASPGPHDIIADPQFINESSGDYHIRFGSPAMNAGLDTIAPPNDYDGVERPQLRHVDMGAFEIIGYVVNLPLVLK